jgi:hypothetical protein
VWFGEDEETIAFRKGVEEAPIVYFEGFSKKPPTKGSMIAYVQKAPACSSIGLVLGRFNNPNYSQTLKVIEIKEEGLASRYNKVVDKSKQIRPGDSVVQVNHIFDDSAAMIREISKETTLRLFYKRIERRASTNMWARFTGHPEKAGAQALSKDLGDVAQESSTPSDLSAGGSSGTKDRAGDTTVSTTRWFGAEPNSDQNVTVWFGDGPEDNNRTVFFGEDGSDSKRPPHQPSQLWEDGAESNPSDGNPSIWFEDNMSDVTGRRTIML